MAFNLFNSHFNPHENGNLVEPHFVASDQNGRLVRVEQSVSGFPVRGQLGVSQVITEVRRTTVVQVCRRVTTFQQFEQHYPAHNQPQGQQRYHPYPVCRPGFGQLDQCFRPAMHQNQRGFVPVGDCDLSAHREAMRNAQFLSSPSTQNRMFGPSGINVRGLQRGREHHVPAVSNVGNPNNFSRLRGEPNFSDQGTSRANNQMPTNNRVVETSLPQNPAISILQSHRNGHDPIPTFNLFDQSSSPRYTKNINTLPNQNCPNINIPEPENTMDPRSQTPVAAVPVRYYNPVRAQDQPIFADNNTADDRYDSEGNGMMHSQTPVAAVPMRYYDPVRAQDQPIFADNNTADDRYDSEGDGMMHSIALQKNGPYICELCEDLIFDKSQSYAAHVLSVHYKGETRAERRKRQTAKYKKKNLCLVKSPEGLTVVPRSFKIAGHGRNVDHDRGNDNVDAAIPREGVPRENPNGIKIKQEPV